MKREQETRTEAAISLDLFREYKEQADPWRTESRTWEDFRLGDNDAQWRQADMAQLTAINHPIITRNRIRPAVEQAVATLTNRSPAFTVTGRDDNDVRKARGVANFLSYLWYISDGDSNFKQIADWYYVRSVGYALSFIDPDADDGNGEVMWMALDPWQVFMDPRAKARHSEDDAAHIVVAYEITQEQFENEYPEWVDKITTWGGTYEESLVPDSKNVEEEGIQYDPDDPADRHLLLERYTRVRVPRFNVTDRRSGERATMERDEYERWLGMSDRFFIVEGAPEPIRVNDSAEALRMGIMLRSQGRDFVIQTITNQQKVAQGLIRVNRFFAKDIRKVVSMGDVVLYDELLGITRYPVVSFPNIHTGTPYKRSDVAGAISPQQFVNKMTSLVVANFQAQTNIKLLVPNSQDVEAVAEAWMSTNAVVPFDPSAGAPAFAVPPPVSNAIIATIMDAAHEIEYSFGIFESSMGNAQASHTTFRGTMAIDDMAQRKLRAKLRDLEAGLTRLGTVMLEMAQRFYTADKVVSVIQPDRTRRIIQLNGQEEDIATLSDQFTELEIDQVLDFNKGRYDLVVVAGSSMPVNRWAELEVYMQAFQQGLIDQEEALKKTEIFDREGVLARMGMVNQLKGALAQAEEKIEKLEGDLQTADREVVHSKRSAEMEKWKAGMAKVRAEFEAALKVKEKDAEIEVERVMMALDSTIAEYEQHLMGSTEEKKAA